MQIRAIGTPPWFRDGLLGHIVPPITMNDDQLFARAQAAISASRSLIREAKLAQQTAKAICQDRFHLAVETARVLRKAERHMVELRELMHGACGPGADPETRA